MVDEVKAVDFIYLYFNRALDSVSYSILLGKLAVHGLDGCSLHWMKNWQGSHAQRVVLNGVKCSQQLVISGVP